MDLQVKRFAAHNLEMQYRPTRHRTIRARRAGNQQTSPPWRAAARCDILFSDTERSVKLHCKISFLSSRCSVH